MMKLKLMKWMPSWLNPFFLITVGISVIIWIFVSGELCLHVSGEPAFTLSSRSSHHFSLCVALWFRQCLAPCEAEVTVLGYDGIKLNSTSNYRSGPVKLRTSSVFIGGLPERHRPNQVRSRDQWCVVSFSQCCSVCMGICSFSECFVVEMFDRFIVIFLFQGAMPFHNFTGCIQILEMNDLQGFHKSNAISSGNVGQCRWNNITSGFGIWNDPSSYVVCQLNVYRVCMVWI